VGFRASGVISYTPAKMGRGSRAVRRCGELAKRIEPARGANQNIREGGRPKVGRQAAANGAALSPHQPKQAIRVANVSREDFERWE
jgi:hypothetical protein